MQIECNAVKTSAGNLDGESGVKRNEKRLAV